MKKCAIIAVLLIVVSFAGCFSKYDEADFMGKTSAEIEEKYGKFHCCGKPADDDGLYRNTACGYTLKEARVGFLGTEPEWLFFITFDENGVACGYYEGYRPGG